MYKKHTISAFVPAYNEELLIGKTLTSIPDYVDNIYVIDDGSVDSTCKEVEGCNHLDPRIHLIKHERNNGVGAAIVSGYKQSLKDEIDITVVLAGDNQMDPSQMPRLIERARGMLITPISIGLSVFSLYYKFVLGGTLFMRGVLSFLLFIVGMQFLFFAMLLDMQMDSNSRRALV